MNQPTENKFLESVKEHEMIVVRDNGVDRHVCFKKPGTMNMWFDILTWRGDLLITGDMGSYLFRRVEDMFSFFRMSEDTEKRMKEKGRTLSINPGYWSEKVQAADLRTKVREWSEDRFRKTIKEWFDNHFEHKETSREEKKEAWRRVEIEILNKIDSSSPDMLMSYAMNFEYKGRLPFQDFWDTDPREYTYHFIWCCYAIVWGIKQYDEFQAIEPELEPA